MVDEPTAGLGKSMQIGTINFEITDPLLVQPVFADYYTELRLNNGVLSISLACSVADANNRPELRVVARLRLPLDTRVLLSQSYRRRDRS